MTIFVKAGQHNGFHKEQITMPLMDYVSWSKCNAMLDSPRNFFEKYKHGRQVRPATAAMEFGNLVHQAILEPRKFLDNYVIQPDFGAMQSPKNRAARDEWVASAKGNGSIIVTEDQADTITKMHKRVMEHEAALKILTGGRAEGWAYFWEENFGRYLLGRPDFLTNDGIVVEVKTTSKRVDRRTVMREIFNYGYHGQMALNCMAAGGILNIPDHKRGVWIFIKTTEPFDVAVYTASENVILAGRSKVHRAIHQINEHLAVDPELSDPLKWLGVQGNYAEELEFEPWMLRGDQDYEELTNEQKP